MQRLNESQKIDLNDTVTSYKYNNQERRETVYHNGLDKLFSQPK